MIISALTSDLANPTIKYWQFEQKLLDLFETWKVPSLSLPIKANFSGLDLINQETDKLPTGEAKRLSDPVLIICVILKDSGEL